MTDSPEITRTVQGRRERFKLLGGALCLDFVNTLDWRGAVETLEWLPTYGDLLSWSVFAGALDAAGAGRLTARAVRIDGGRAPAKALAALNAALAATPARRALVASGPGFVWAREAGQGGFDEPLRAVAWSAGDLLASNRLSRLKRCADRTCGWLFLDESRSGRRRWCSMADCGNRAKARRHHARLISRNSLA